MDILNAILQGALLGGVYALFATGLSIMFGVMRIVNLAHGDLAVLAAFLAFTLATETMFPLWLVVLVTIPLFSVVGYLVQRLLITPSLSAGPLATLLSTFGLSIVIQNALVEGFSANVRSLDAGGLASASLGVGGGIALPVVGLVGLAAAVVVIAASQVFFALTRTGRMMRAVSDDVETATITGANSKHVYGVATALAFGTLTLAGLLFATRSSFSPTSGTMTLVFAFEAVVIGGLGSLWGTLLGGLVLGLTQSVVANYDPAGAILAGHLIFLAVLAFRPQGLVPARSI
ncbi:branched-chain amino acid ABC transporter permease [Pseudonocardia sp. GCM10023141]|uniref:branched-chain amino acid ABC transporter permease n=1 Tax=Pseudonocardia sp. GCM10023141 TaxID=3252653 RepID=UPI003617B32D